MNSIEVEKMLSLEFPATVDIFRSTGFKIKSRDLATSRAKMECEAPVSKSALKNL